jgi:hypothetical protein
MSYMRNRKTLRICRDKKTYSSKHEAERAALSLVRAGKAVKARAYRCNGAKGQVKHWHVTTTFGRKP